MSLIDTRFLNLVSSLFLDACAGSPYAVSLYSAQLKTQLQLTQVQLNTVESAGDVGLYLTVVAGVAYESIGPKATAAVGAFLSLAGYALMWLAVNGNAASSVPALALYAFLWNHGSSWLSTCAVTTAIKSMTGDRGVAMGLVRSMFGLSAALLGVIYFSTFQPSATAAAAAGNASVASASLASYFLFCAITFTGIALVAGLAARVPSPAESAAPLRQAEQLRIVWAGVIVALLVFYVTGAGVAGAHGSLPPSPAWAFALLALLLPLLGLVFRQRVYAALADYFCCCGRKAAATADSAADVDAVVAATIKRNHSSGLLVSVASSSSVASMTMGSHHYSADTDAAGADESVNALSAPLLEGAAETGMMHPATPTRSGSAMVVTSGAGFSLPEGGSDAEPMVLHLDDPTARAPVIVYSHSGRTPGSSSVAAELAVAAAAAAGASGMFAPHPAAEFDDEATATSDAAPGRVGGDAVAKQLPATPTFASAGRRESLAALSAKRTASSSRAAAAASVPRLAIADDGQPATRSSNARVDSGSAAVAVTADVHRRHRVAADPTFTDDSDLPLPLSKEVGASLCEAVCGLDYLLILLCLFAGTGCGIVVINNLSNLVESLAGGPGSLPTGGELPYLILFCELQQFTGHGPRAAHDRFTVLPSRCSLGLLVVASGRAALGLRSCCPRVAAVTTVASAFHRLAPVPNLPPSSCSYIQLQGPPHCWLGERPVRSVRQPPFLHDDGTAVVRWSHAAHCIQRPWGALRCRCMDGAQLRRLVEPRPSAGCRPLWRTSFREHLRPVFHRLRLRVFPSVHVAGGPPLRSTHRRASARPTG